MFLGDDVIDGKVDCAISLANPAVLTAAFRPFDHFPP